MTARRRFPFRRKLWRALAAVALLVAVFIAERGSEYFDFGFGDDASAGLPADAEGPCLVLRVIDGDTVRVRCDGVEEKIRMLRIDTPERDEARYHEASEALRRRVGGREVYLVYEEPGEPTRGNHGRLLAYLYADGQNVNVEMVREGWSRFDTRWGEGRFAAAFRAAERERRGGG